MLELKPCPFCGSKAQLLETEYGYQPQTVGFGRRGNIVICTECQAQTNEYRSRIETIKAWNKRHE